MLGLLSGLSVRVLLAARLELVEYGASGEVLYAGAPLPWQTLVGPQGRKSLTKNSFVWLSHRILRIVGSVARRQPDLFDGSNSMDEFSEDSRKRRPQDEIWYEECFSL